MRYARYVLALEKVYAAAVVFTSPYDGQMSFDGRMSTHLATLEKALDAVLVAKAVPVAVKDAKKSKKK